MVPYSRVGQSGLGLGERGKEERVRQPVLGASLFFLFFLSSFLLVGGGSEDMARGEAITSSNRGQQNLRGRLFGTCCAVSYKGLCALIQVVFESTVAVHRDAFSRAGRLSVSVCLSVCPSWVRRSGAGRGGQRSDEVPKFRHGWLDSLI